MSNTAYNEFFKDVAKLLENARIVAIRRVDVLIVQTYWQVGKRIIVEEQGGERRAEYGKMQLKRLSGDLTKRFGKGFSIDNLELMRRFYLAYPAGVGISETVSRKSQKALTGAPRVVSNNLAWSHYCELLSVEDERARAFYQVEASRHNWSVRELKRQINALLFERLALSKNKKRVLELARKGHHIEKPEDAIKNPYILEFLGIPEKSYYTESQLEQKLIERPIAADVTDVLGVREFV